MNIKAATQLIGINENTLRAWERRYKVLAPARDPLGRRIYTQKNIEKLNLLWSLVQKSHLIGNLVHQSTTQLKALNRQVLSTNQVSKVQNLTEDVFEKKHLRKIIEALKNFDLTQIQSSLQSSRFELSPKTMLTQLVLPLIQEVGKLVKDSKLKVSQEHLLSSLLRDHLGQLYQSLSPFELRNKYKRLVLTTREGDLHEFGILLAAILCRINGHEAFYLGPNMPVQDLAEACENFKIDEIILGLASLPKEREIITTNLYLKKLDQKTPQRINIICGGNSSIDEKSIKSGRQFTQFSTLEELDEYLNSSQKR
jgi:MerR family transcriptional regulator, light-induced transcriptional regulator